MIEPKVHLFSPNFDVENLFDYRLKVEIYTSSVRIGVFNDADNGLLSFEEYTFDSLDESTLEALYASHVFLAANFWKSIKLSINSAVLIPFDKNVFEPGHEPHYKHLFLPENCNVELVQARGSDFLVGLDAAFVRFFETKYPEKKVLGTTPALEVLAYAKSSNQTIVFCCEQRYFLLQEDLTVFNNSSKCDVKGKCLLVGEVTKYNPLYTSFKNQSECSFAEVSNIVKIPPFAIDLNGHRYLSLFL